MKKLIAVIAVMMTAQAAFAGECALIISREACPGKEAEALKPYDGKNPAKDTKKVDTEAACIAWAEKSAKIQRKGTLASKKVISIRFDGKDIGDVSKLTSESACK
jgi:hypothetical protein